MFRASTTFAHPIQSQHYLAELITAEGSYKHQFKSYNKE